MNFSKQERYAFFGTLLFGLLAHAHMLTNNYQYHDDVGFYALGAGFQLGRGSNVILGKLFRLFFGGDIISLSLFNGIIALIFLALTAVLVVRILKLKNYIFAALIGGIMAVFPSVTSNFGYRYQAYAWALTFLLSASGVYLITEGKFYAPARYFICVMFQVFAIGIYQAVIPFTLSLATLYIFRHYIEENCTWKNYFGEILKWSGISAAFMALYALCTILPYWVFLLMGKEFKLSGYQGINEAGNISFSEIINRIFTAYKEAFFPPLNTSGDMYPMSVRFFFYVILIISVCLTVKIIINLYSHSVRKCLQCVITSLALPLMINFIYVMCNPLKTRIYSNMQYSEIFIFVYFWLILEINYNSVNVKNYLFRTALILTGIVCLLYIRFDNICYLKADYMQKRAVSYFTVLQSRIQSIPGYRDDYPVVLVNRYDKSRQNVTHTKQWDDIYIPPYNMEKHVEGDILDNYTWVKFMNMHVGFSPEVYYAGNEYVFDNPKRILKLDTETETQVNLMNRYPSDGSIKIIDGKVFVKF
ncbi:MAG: glucosyltransferase domain-containing protein [Synergistaceae bacterium]|nr:glucosyltransferase domain-containing protein [Synergistaceae bacterium]